ncbi:MAG TPA: AAA family ATPase [Pyrinomonadaceae bacterium]|nr:AAA family ATPase [Pyrinomonadaceae bacterium]
MTKRQLEFGAFRFDEANECIWEGENPIPLRPKPYAILKYLIERPKLLVTKQQLLDDVWPETFVSDAVLKDCIRQLREALRDDAKSPTYIETAHRRGYRFIAPVAELKEQSVASQTHSAAAATPSFIPYPSPQPLPPPNVNVLGRESALECLHKWLSDAVSSNSQIVFVTGEAGIGKTTVVDAFLAQAKSANKVFIARGNCLEQYGAGEAYLPVFDSLRRLARTRGPELIEILRRHAPSWLVQMPGLTTASEREMLQEEVAGVTRERMLREIAEALEALTAQIPLILVLEDLHWCDYSTLDLISYLARGHYAPRLLLIGTYRPVEIIVMDHPLKDVKRELQIHKLCHELPLEYLSPAAVAEFLNLRFPGHEFPPRLASMIHRRTEGNPLFIVNVMDYLVDAQIVTEVDDTWKLRVDLDEAELGVPENLRNMIEKHIERLTPEEQRILEGASVVGMDCSAAAMSAGLAEDIVRIEEVCDALARRHSFLLPAYLAALPDGTITPRYRFIHALYLNVLYNRVAPTRRSQIHGRIGERGEAAYGDSVSEIAAELAVHFEQSRDLPRAVKYLQMAAENAAGRSAHREAIALAKRGLELLKSLPDSSQFAEQQSKLRERLSESREQLTEYD